MDLKALVRDVPDFPKAGILFKDITPLLGDAKAFAHAIDRLAEFGRGLGVTKVVGIESRGFILAPPVAIRLGAGFVPVRKQGKLPWRSRRERYGLEYGSDTIELHEDAVRPSDRVLVIDDVLATGGTAAASIRLVRGLGATVVGAAFLLELGFLAGKQQLDVPVFSVLAY